jgi:threonine dehydratase
MPEYTPLVKVTATRAWGAEVILFGANYDEALEEAKRRCRVENLVCLNAFDDPAVIAGQRTIGLELLEQIPDMDAVVMPVGGGGLIAGVACAVKETRPEVRIVGIQPQALPAMEAALLLRKPVMLPAAATIADGIAVRQLVS